MSLVVRSVGGDFRNHQGIRLRRSMCVTRNIFVPSRNAQAIIIVKKNCRL